MASDVRIRVQMNTADAVRNAGALARAVNRAMTSIAADTRLATVATREFTRAQIGMSDASLIAARSSAAMGRALIAQEAATQRMILAERAYTAELARQAAIRGSMPIVPRTPPPPLAPLSRAGSRLGAIGGGLSAAGGALTHTITYPIVAGAAVSVAAAVSRESSFTGISKLYSSNEDRQALPQLNKDMIALTHTLPLTYKELASFGELGGQLGVPIRALGEFEKVAGQLGLTTDASGELAATGLAKIAAATGVAKEDFAAFFRSAGSALSQMSRDGATTTSQILNMTMRFASAGKLAHMTVPDMFALANAVGSMGQEAEAGGSAMQTLISKIELATAQGGNKLARFANVAGMTSAQFKTLFERDGFAGIMAFVKGLGRLEQSGHSSIEILTNMGITNVRLRQSVLNLAQGFDDAARYRIAANKAAAEGNVLDKTTGEVARTAGSQFKIFWNTVEETAAAFGDNLVPSLKEILPAFKAMLEDARDLAKSFAGLPHPIQEAIIVTMTLAAALGPLLTGLGAIVTVAGAIARGFAAVGLSGATMVTGLARAFATGGPVLVGLAVAAGAIWLIKERWDQVKAAQDDAKDGAQRYADQLARMKMAGGNQAATAVNNDLTRELDQLKTALAETLKQPAGANLDTFIQSNLAGQGFDPKKSPFINSVMGVRGRIASDQADLQKVKTLQHEQVISGAGEAKRAADTAGVSDLAKSVVSHAFDSINTPQNVASCALFLSEIYKRAGAQVPAGGIASAKGLMDWAVKQGATAHPTSQALPGDLIVWHGNRYGASQKGGGRSGYHVGLSLGDGKIRQSSDGVVKTMSLYDAAHAQAFTIPTAGGRSVSGLGNQPFDPSLFEGSAKDKAAKDHAQALIDAAGLNVAKAEASLEHCKNEYTRTKDPYYLILAKAALVKVRDARMGEAQATLNKALLEAKKQNTNGEAAQAAFTASKFKINMAFTNDTQALGDQFGGTPAEKQQRARDLRIAQQRNLLQGTQIAIDNYQRWMDRGDARQYDPLKDAFGKLRDRQIGMAGMEYENQSASGKLADPGQEKVRLQTLAAERDNKIKAANNQYAQSIIDLDEKHLNLQAQVYVREKDRLDLQRQMLDLDLQSAKSDDEKLAAKQAIFENIKAQLLAQKEIDSRSTDPNTKAMAGTRYTLGIQSAQKELGQYSEDISDAARDRRIQFLRAEIEATDNLITKGAMLVAVHKLEMAAAKDTGNMEAVLGAMAAANTERMNNDRAVMLQSADKALSSRLMTGQGDVKSILTQYEDLIDFGSLDQQREALSTYLDVITSLIQVHAISRKEALADLKNVSDEHKDIMTPGQAKDYKEATNQVKGMITVGGRAFWSEMTKSAADNSGGFIAALLTGKGAKNAMQSFFTSLASMAEQGISGAVSGSIQNAIMGGGLFGKHHKDAAGAIAPASTAAITATTVATDSAAATTNAAGNVITTAASTVKQLPKATKESRLDMYQGAARIAAAAAALSVAMNPKKAKKASAWGLAGAVVGGIIGAYAGDWAGGAQIGAGFGSMLGSAFADGGAPPVGKISLGGERGPEPFVTANGRVSWIGLDGPQLFMPRVPGVVIPNHMIPRAPSMAFAGISPQMQSGGSASGYSRGDDSAPIHATQVFNGDIHRTIDLEQANRSFGKMLGTLRRNGGRPAGG